VLCGGTGLYLAALAQGLADIPDPGPAARTQARALLAELGPERLHARLAEVDPASAARLRPTDSQRLARAWEVWRGTGRGIAAWLDAQAAGDPQPGWDFRVILLDPPRDTLRAAIEQRFEAMLQLGALEEVRGLLALRLDPALPAMRAHGVPELAAALRGEITLAEAARRAVLATGQYTRRQATWFRHRHIAGPDATHRFLARYGSHAQDSESILGQTLQIILQPG
jgi:tRNA dimethylallyltransferase